MLTWTARPIRRLPMQSPARLLVTDAMEKLTLEQTASDAFDQFLDAAEEADK